ncbi:MAG: hypothetical protein GY795_45700 [Desulfobacterales bacterium]|nr:hypothetical protein [Desulfobacterales bacterium]
MRRIFGGFFEGAGVDYFVFLGVKKSGGFLVVFLRERAWSILFFFAWETAAVF